MNFLNIENLVVPFKNFKLNDISLGLQKGKILAVLGPSGSGKSILLETVAGFHKPIQGDIWLNGQNITRLPPESRRIGFVFQDFALFPHKTVLNNISFPLKLRREQATLNLLSIDEIVHMLNLGHLMDRYPTNLSGGEKQRVALARALVSGSQLYLFDEPMSSIDYTLRETLLEELQYLCKNLNMTAIYVTHDLQEALTLGDYIAIIYEGKLLQYGLKEQVFKRPVNPVAAGFLGMENLLPGEVVDIVKGDAIIRLESGSNLILTGSTYDKFVKGQKVTLGIRSEDIQITEQVNEQSPVDNTVKAKISGIIPIGFFYKIKVSPILLTIYLLKREIEQWGLAPGGTIWLNIKKDKIHLFP
ncbi:MAG: ABC transporter ATP-binding protein [Eubacteriales bacterium]